MDFSKAFEIINHDLRLSKLRVYVSRKILFHLLESISQTGTNERKLAALLVAGTKSLLVFLRGQYQVRRF